MNIGQQAHIDSPGVLSVFLVIRKQTLIRSGAVFCCLLGLLSFIWLRQTSSPLPVFSAESRNPITVVIDAGHGGEDGGAVSTDGTIAESHLNLAIALRVNDLMRFSGQSTAMTRTDHLSLHTEGDTIRTRKASDIRNRVKLVNEAGNAVLVSIHQNSLPSSPVTHGAQVFWNQYSGAESLAKIVQDTVNPVINPDHPKQPRPIPDSIYLMKNVTAPAILIECGFLSNREDTAKLQDPVYQTKLAAAITTGYLRCRAGEDVP